MSKEIGNIRVMMKMIGLVTPMIGWMMLAVLMGVIGFLCAILLPVSGAVFIAQTLDIIHWFTQSQLIVFMISIAIMRGVLHYIEQACNHYIAFKLLAILRDRIFAKLRTLAPAKLEGKDKGNLIALITSDIELLEVFYAHTISPILIALFTCLILLSLFAQLHSIYVVIALIAYATIGILLPILNSRKGKHIGDACRKALGSLSSYTLESIRGLREILQYNQGNQRIEELHRQSEAVNEDQKQLRNIEGASNAASGLAVQCFSLLILFCGLGLQVHGTVSFANVLIATILMFSSFGPVIALANVSNNLLLTLASGRRVLALLEEQPQIEEIKGCNSITSGDIRLEAVTFAYEDECILNHVSETFQKGKITGILGKSGSGKSTILKLMMRFWDVQQGSVTIHNEDVRKINTKQLRDLQSFVTQETVLFHDTIANNVKLANLNASQEEIEEACKKASIHDMIVALPNGYETNVAELGDSLSGGEKQRIALARAFLHDGEYILLDEPTSNLDVLNESVILSSLNALQEKTVILVSHRASTMSICDEILHMSKGRIG